MRAQQIKLMGSFAMALCGEIFWDHAMIPWLRAQSEVPFHMWLCPSGTTITPTQQRTKMASLDAFYQGYSGHSRTGIHQKNSRAPFQYVSPKKLQSER
eukprot:15329792-Ditylum_brightwellii.AAC.1